MKFPISAGAYMLIVTIVYAVVGLCNVFVYPFTQTEYIQMVWSLILMIPVVLPVGRWVSGAPMWKI